MQYLLKVDGLVVKLISIQHLFVLSDFLSEFLLRYSFIHFNIITGKGVFTLAVLR